MQEWLNWPLSKSGELQGSEGSNPSLSARKELYKIMTKKEVETKPVETVVVKPDNSLAIMSMVFGVVSLSGPGLFFGIPAIIMGAIALRRKQGEKGLSITGIVTGIVSTLISLVFIGLLVFGIIWGMNHPEYQDDTHPRNEYRLESSRT